MSCTTDQLANTLEALSRAPQLIITDSQVFHEVYRLKPESSLLTSFSVLMAGYKGEYTLLYRKRSKPSAALPRNRGY